MSDSDLLLLNSQGFIPGPSETEEEFVERVAHVKVKFGSDQQIPRAHWDWSRVHLKEIFDFEPHYLSAFYSNRSLAPWQGAVSWIECGRIAAVQLREELRKGSYWGYNRSEILAHEAVHAARSAFDEPIFEEFFAFMASEKWWRRAFGPMIQRPIEVWIFLVSIAVGMFFFWSHLITVSWIGAGFWRLMRIHAKVRRCGKNLMSAIGNPKWVRATLMRLTDAEIELFAKGGHFFAYANQQQCLRWRLIRLAYLNLRGKHD